MAVVLHGFHYHTDKNFISIKINTFIQPSVKTHASNKINILLSNIDIEILISFHPLVCKCACATTQRTQCTNNAFLNACNIKLQTEEYQPEMIDIIPCCFVLF
jgi:hypothetical protein